MTNKTYLDYLHDVLGWMSNQVCMHTTALGQANKSQSLEALSDDPSNYKDVYVMRSKTHDWLRDVYDTWQTENGKIIPKNVELTPTIVRHWYCGDGCLDFGGRGEPSARIKAEFMQDHLNRIREMFGDIGFKHHITDNGAIIISQTDTREFLQWMSPGHPVPGFEYKWTTSIEEQKKLRSAYESTQTISTHE